MSVPVGQPLARGRRVALAVVAAVFASALVVKLALVWGEGIRPVGFDATSFANSARHWYWGLGYGRYNYIRQPVYPLFVALTSAIGLPTRVAIELAWFAGAVVMYGALRACGLLRVLAGAAAIAMVFHPWTWAWFNHLLQDTLYAPLAVGFVCALAGAACAADGKTAWRWGGLAAGLGALASCTRPESVVLFGSVAVAATMVMLPRVRTRALWREGLRRLLPVAAAPVVAIVVFSGAIRAANYATIGSAVTTDLLLPGQRDMYSALLAIEPDDGDPRLPIPRDVRERAYAASPTFARLRPFLDGEGRPERMDAFQKYARHLTRAEGEFSGWTIWALRDAAWSAAGGEAESFRSAAELDAFFKAAAVELRAAAADGRLQTRRVLIPFVPPEWGRIAQLAPTTLERCWEMIARAKYRPYVRKADEEARPEIFDPITRSRNKEEATAAHPMVIARYGLLSVR